jgi:hypothetical protein
MIHFCRICPLCDQEFESDTPARVDFLLDEHCITQHKAESR